VSGDATPAIADVAIEAGRSSPASAPLVSVLIPSYERPRYLREALASVVAQTYRNLEIIVHDNASPTDPAPVVAAFADPRIALYRNARNLGVTPNLAAGFAKCKGTYVAILGDDDLWHAEFVASLVAALERHPEAVVAFCDHDVVDEDGTIDAALSDEVTRRYGRDALAEGVHRPFGEIALKRHSICVMSGALLRRGAADWTDLPPEVSLGSDLYIADRAARTGGACYFVLRRLMHYRYHRNSLSRRVETDVEYRIGNARAAVYYWNRFLRDSGITECKPYFEMKRGLNALLIVLCLLRRGSAGAALAELRDFLRRGLIHPRIFLQAWRLRRARV
jgi:glycosyltransferase involved in cell wall biosynthesis